MFSGAFAFGAYALDAGAANVYTYNLAYNSFVFVDILLVIVAGALLLSSKSFVAETKKFSANAQAEKPFPTAPNPPENNQLTRRGRCTPFRRPRLPFSPVCGISADGFFVRFSGCFLYIRGFFVRIFKGFSV